MCNEYKRLSQLFIMLANVVRSIAYPCEQKIINSHNNEHAVAATTTTNITITEQEKKHVQLSKVASIECGLAFAPHIVVVFVCFVRKTFSLDNNLVSDRNSKVSGVVGGRLDRNTNDCCSLNSVPTH